MGSVPLCAQTYIMFEDFPYIGTLPIFGKTSHMWEYCSDVGRHATHGKTSHTWDPHAALSANIVDTQQHDEQRNGLRPDCATLSPDMYIYICTYIYIYI